MLTEKEKELVRFQEAERVAAQSNLLIKRIVYIAASAIVWLVFGIVMFNRHLELLGIDPPTFWKCVGGGIAIYFPLRGLYRGVRDIKTWEGGGREIFWKRFKRTMKICAGVLVFFGISVWLIWITYGQGLSYGPDHKYLADIAKRDRATGEKDRAWKRKYELNHMARDLTDVEKQELRELEKIHPYKSY